MPLVVYSVLRLALFGACWWVLVWAGLDPWLAVVAAAFLAWGLSYVTLPGPRDAAARWLAEQAARRKAGVPTLSARAQRDAADEDALVEAAADEGAVDEGAWPQAAGGEAAPDDHGNPDLHPAPDPRRTPSDPAPHD